MSNIELVNAFIAPAQWIWEKEIGKRFGLDSYQDLQDKLVFA